MPLLTFALAWTGYSLFVYGLATVRSCNISWTEIAIPKGALGLNKAGYSGCNPDPPGGSGGGGLGTTTLKTPKNPKGITINSLTQAQSILSNSKSTTAQKQAAAAYIYASQGGAS